MQQRYRLKKNGQFHYVYKKGKRQSSREMILYFTKAPRLLVGFSVNKKIGNVVVRNRIKRRLREAFRPQIPFLKRGMYVFSVKEAASDAGFSDLQRSMIYCLTKGSLYKNS